MNIAVFNEFPASITSTVFGVAFAAALIVAAVTVYPESKSSGVLVRTDTPQLRG
jgi:hypothetical protein